MIIYSLRIIYLILYLFIASQGTFYLLGINKAFATISIKAFIEQRKAVDLVIGGPLRFLYFSSLGIGVLIVACTAWQPPSHIFVTTLISFLCLTIDLFLAIRKSIPLNQIVNQYSPDNASVNYEDIRKQWITFINYRGMVTLSGLLALLSGFLIGNK
jgi:hypothetical protein